MEVIALVVLVAAVGVAVLFVRRTRKSAPKEVQTSVSAKLSVIDEAPAASPSPLPMPRDLPGLLDDDHAEGTTKIDRDALRGLVGGESSVVEEAYFLVISGEGIGRFIKLERDEYVIGRDAATADIVFHDDAISKRHARVRMRDGMVEIEDLGSSNGTFVDGREITKTVLTDGARVVLGRSTVLTLTFQDEIGEQFKQKMYESSTRDRLTGANNKATFYDQLASEMHFARRHGTNYCIIMLDIDHFKAINDTHGHLVGDEILGEVADVIRSVTRDEALFVRYGGEEFIIGERNADLAMGTVVAERVRKAVADHVFETSAGPLSVTVSLGVADVRVIETPDTVKLVEAADKALYQAKGSGRNRVCAA